jgi:glycine/D-amino acid oxidase-like deaminating enzyme
MRVLICGGGVIACTAYFLARRGIDVVVVKRTEVTNYSGFVVSDRDARRHVLAKLDLLSEGVIISRRFGTPEPTAIVHPRKFTSAMMSAAQRHGPNSAQNGCSALS